jgi:hypothetical protein
MKPTLCTIKGRIAQDFRSAQNAPSRMNFSGTLPLRARNLGVKERRPYYLWGWVQYAKQATRRWLALHHPTDGWRERVSMTQDNGRPGRRLIWVICGLCRADHAATVMEGETPLGKSVYRRKSRIPSPRRPPNQTSPPTNSSMSYDACFTFRPLPSITGEAL